MQRIEAVKKKTKKHTTTKKPHTQKIKKPKTTPPKKNQKSKTNKTNSYQCSLPFKNTQWKLLTHINHVFIQNQPTQNKTASLFKVKIVAIQAQMKFLHTLTGLFYTFLPRENNQKGIFCNTYSKVRIPS